MNLYALNKKECFKPNELNQVIQEERERHSKCFQYWQKLNDFWHEKFGISASHHFEKIQHSPDQVDEMFSHPICEQVRTELNLSEPTTLLTPTSCRVLNYYFHHCEETHWSEVAFPIDHTLLEVSVSPECSGTCLRDLLDDFKVLHPEQVPLVVERIITKKQISELDLKIVSFLKAFPNHVFVFI